MKFDKAQEFFSDYIESTLDRPMTVALETHLSGCEVCSTDVADLRSMWTVLDKVPAVEPPADFVWKTTTRLQNEVLNRREAERAKPLPWWKRLTPVQSFSYASIAALLVVGLTIGVNSTIGNTTGWDVLSIFRHHTSSGDGPAPVAPVVTAPSFDAQVPGVGGAAATVTITATSATPNAEVAVAYLTPSNGKLVGRPQVWGHRRAWAARESWTLAIPDGNARAVEVTVFSGNSQVAQKRLILPPAANATPVTSLQNADPYFALQQVAGRTGQAILIDTGLTNPVTLDLTSVGPQQALGQSLTQIGLPPGRTSRGVLNLTK
jgi:hypothetical protein